MKKLLFIYNPHAGKAKLRTQLAEIVEVFDQNGWVVTVRPTQKAKDATQFLLEGAEEFDRIVVGGGDGTLHEALCGIREAAAAEKKAPPLGFLPAGSTNDFAKSLRIPTEASQAARIAAAGKLFPCDAGSFCGQPFTYVAAFGAFTKVSYSTPQKTKNVLGHFAYLLEGVKELPQIRGIPMTVRAEQEEFSGRYIYGMVSNTASVGGFNGIYSDLQVSLDDGLLEVLLVKEPQTLAERSALLADLMRMNMKSKFITALKTKSITFKPESELSWTLDGEFGGAPAEVEIRVLPHAYSIIVPEDLPSPEKKKKPRKQQTEPTNE